VVDFSCSFLVGTGRAAFLQTIACRSLGYLLYPESRRHDLSSASRSSGSADCLVPPCAPSPVEIWNSLASFSRCEQELVNSAQLSGYLSWGNFCSILGYDLGKKLKIPQEKSRSSPRAQFPSAMVQGRPLHPPHLGPTDWQLLWGRLVCDGSRAGLQDFIPQPLAESDFLYSHVRPGH